eukprot:COSAG03_NODE_2317_length_2889_cov_26.777419_2_plen_70_part_00
MCVCVLSLPPFVPLSELCGVHQVRIFLHHSSVPYVSAKTIQALSEADPGTLEKALAKGGSMLSLPAEEK